MTKTKDKFSLGVIVMSSDVANEVGRATIRDAINRHAKGDWGEVCKEAWEENELAIIKGRRLLSSYRNDEGKRFWILTEADRTSTTVMIPEDY
jgi:hypothetical protein